MALSEMNYIEGGGSVVYEEYGRSITADTPIDVGFAPKTVILVCHTPNYARTLFVFYWDSSNPNYQYCGEFGSTSYGTQYSMPYTGTALLIKDISGSTVTIGYNSSVAPITVDIFAFPN